MKEKQEATKFGAPFLSDTVIMAFLTGLLLSSATLVILVNGQPGGFSSHSSQSSNSGPFGEVHSSSSQTGPDGITYSQQHHSDGSGYGPGGMIISGPGPNPQNLPCCNVCPNGGGSWGNGGGNGWGDGNGGAWGGSDDQTVIAQQQGGGGGLLGGGDGDQQQVRISGSFMVMHFSFL